MKVYLLCDESKVKNYESIIAEGAAYPKVLPRHFGQRNCGPVTVYFGEDAVRQAFREGKTHIVTLNIASLASAVYMTASHAFLANTYPNQYVSVEECAAIC